MTFHKKSIKSYQQKWITDSHSVRTPKKYFDNTILRPIVTIATHSMFISWKKRNINSNSACSNANHHRLYKKLSKPLCSNEFHPCISRFKGLFTMQNLVSSLVCSHTNAHKTKPKASFSQPMLTLTFRTFDIKSHVFTIKSLVTHT